MSAGGLTPKILIIDDDPDIRAILRDTLSSCMFAVSEAEDGLAGWEMLLQVRPHIVITDHSMPRLSGRFLCKRIKADPALRRTWVIVHTGWNSETVGEMFSDCPADAYVAKPKISDLVEALWGGMEKILASRGKEEAALA